MVSKSEFWWENRWSLGFFLRGGKKKGGGGWGEESKRGKKWGDFPLFFGVVFFFD